MKISSKLIFLFLLIIYVKFSFAEELFKIIHCHKGARYDCTDCDPIRVATTKDSFTILKSKSSVIIDTFENGKRTSSFTLRNCIISDKFNWLCYLPIKNSNDDYDETITHKMERGFYEFKASSQLGQVRYCGIRAAN